MLPPRCGEGAHDADERDVQVPAASCLGLGLEVAAAADLGLGGRGLYSGNDRFRQRRRLARSPGVLSPEAFQCAAHAGMRGGRRQACLLEDAGYGGRRQLWLLSAPGPAR